MLNCNVKSVGEDITNYSEIDKQIEQRMLDAGQDQVVINNYLRLLEGLRDFNRTGINPGLMPEYKGDDTVENAVRPLTLEDMTIYEIINNEHYIEIGMKIIERGEFGIVYLNGGMGTSMGLKGPKGLLEIQDGKTIWDFAVQRSKANNTPLFFMESFVTKDESAKYFSEKHAEINIPRFYQNQHLKVRQDSLEPVTSANEDLNWNPPGHGDIYTALYLSGMLYEMREKGVKYFMTASIDNPAPVADPAIAGYMQENKVPLMALATKKTPIDVKGGSFVKDAVTGRIRLREGGQVPANDASAASNIDTHINFNTNICVFDVEAMIAEFEKREQEALEQNRSLELFPLSPIYAGKRLDPSSKDNSDSNPKVWQLETAHSDIVGSIPGAQVLFVPRNGFFDPIKNTSDLLIERSDAMLKTDGRVLKNPNRNFDIPPVIKLSDNYKFVGDYEQLIPQGNEPSLVDCESLEITGKVYFGQGVRIVGEVKIEGDRIGDDKIENQTLGLKGLKTVIKPNGTVEYLKWTGEYENNIKDFDKRVYVQATDADIEAAKKAVN